jgi:hypothetical protein
LGFPTGWSFTTHKETSGTINHAPAIYYADLGYIIEYSDDRKAWDEWPRRVDRKGYDDLKNEQRPYRLEDVLVAHCRRKEFSEYFLPLMECSDDEIYTEK